MSEASSICHIWLDCHTYIINTYIHDELAKCVCVCVTHLLGVSVCLCLCDALARCVCVCVHNNVQTTADICFLLGNYADLRKFSDKFVCKNYRSKSQSFSEGLKSLGTVTSIDNRIYNSRLNSPHQLRRRKCPQFSRDKKWRTRLKTGCYWRRNTPHHRYTSGIKRSSRLRT